MLRPMSAPSPDPEVARLVFEEAVRDLTGQEAAVDELRRRAATVLAASSIATSFLAPAALLDRTNDPSVFSWIGIASIVAVAILIAGVLWPWKGWQFRAKTDILLKDYYRGEHHAPPWPLSIERAHVRLAEYAASWSTRNDRRLRSLHYLFRWAVIAVPIGVVAWVVDLMFCYEGR